MIPLPLHQQVATDLSQQYGGVATGLQAERNVHEVAVVVSTGGHFGVGGEESQWSTATGTAHRARLGKVFDGQLHLVEQLLLKLSGFSGGPGHSAAV